MWWNVALGGSMLLSSLSSLTSTIAKIVTSSNNPQANNSEYSYGSNFINHENIFLRLSKYPSKSTIGYGMF